MTSRWLNLLLGVALLQGTWSFSPIDESNEEWIEYRNMMRDIRYRLPPVTRPSNYRVHLTPHLASGADQFTFDGEVSININTALNQATRQITLHCNDLTINPESVFVASTVAPTVNLVVPGQTFQCGEFDFLKINTESDLVSTQTYTVTMTFKGHLQTNMRGFYRSWYIDANRNRRWMATTQFQPGHARQAFPCYDEPGFKATFDISITRDVEGFSQTLSNMPMISSQLLSNSQKIRENFATTPVTSTYLLAFIVSDYMRVAEGTNPARPFHIYARRNIGTTGLWSLEIGEPLLEVMERYTGIDYYSMATNAAGNNIMELKQAAIPDFSAGAMENWGLLTYREALILFDPQNSNNFYKQRVANIISHEIAHMWFGNLVTCAWWDNLWLNEGFARFYQYYLTGVVAPELGFETRFITEQVQVSLLSDSATNAHALTNPSVSNPSSVSNHFSQITYGKGASVLRMTQHLLGNDTYVAGLQSYLYENKYATAVPETLFAALQSAASRDNALSQYPNITVADYFKSWTVKGGHPLVTVTVDHDTGRMTVSQTRFYLTAVTEESNDLWYIPITWTRAGAGAAGFETLKPSQILNSSEDVIERGSQGEEWVIFNKQQSGFYRVNYDQTTWNLITRALRSGDREIIHEYNRAQIVDDVFVLARSEKMNYNRAFNILSFLKFETAYAPWLAAVTGFNFALRRLAHSTIALGRLRNEILDLSEAVVGHLGINEPATGSSFMDDLQRMHVMTFLCNVGHQGCINAARISFSAWRNNNASIPPNMRPWVYCNGLRYGNHQDYDFFWSRYLTTDLASEQVVMLTAAGCTQDQPSLNRFLSNIVNTENYAVRPQDYTTAVNSAVTSNEYNTIRVFQWLQSNLERVRQVPAVLRSMVSTISSRLLTEAEIISFENWVNGNEVALGTEAVAAARSGVANSRANIKFYDDRVPEFNEYFETGFYDPTDPNPPISTGPTTLDPTTEDTTTSEITTVDTTISEETTTDPTTTEPTTIEPTTQEVTTEIPTTAEPDSANIASLSIMTLIVTLVINMV